MDKNKILEIAKTSKVEGWPYPKTFEALKDGGVISYEVKVANHEITFFGENSKVQEPIPHDFQSLAIASEYCFYLLKEALEKSQSKKIGYEEFLLEIAKAGVPYYKVDMAVRTVTYFGVKPGEEYVEIVPTMKN